MALEEELQREGQRLPNMTHPGGCGCWAVGVARCSALICSKA